MPLLRRLATGALVLATVAVLGGCTLQDNGNNTLVGSKDSPTPTAPGGPQTTGPAVSPGGGPIAVEAKDNEFAPKEIAAKAGDITINVKDTGVAPHTFTLTELHADVALNAGQSAPVRLTGVKAGTYKFVCKYHESIGMVGQLTVT